MAQQPSTAYGDADAPSITERIQSLPQELQDLILEYVLEPDLATKDIIYITPDYKPPFSLHLDRASRAKTLRTYYSQNTFEAPFEQLQLFLASLLPTALIKIQTIHLGFVDLEEDFWAECGNGMPRGSANFGNIAKQACARMLRELKKALGDSFLPTNKLQPRVSRRLRQSP